MKNTLYRYLSAVKRNLSIYVLLIKDNLLVFILSLCLLISLLSLLRTSAELNKYVYVDDIKGFYKTLPEVDLQERMVVSDNEYFVFENNKFYRYIDSKIVDEGTYKRKYKHVYILKSKNINDCIFYLNKSFYFYDKNKDYVIKFVKTPTAPINVQSN